MKFWRTNNLLRWLADNPVIIVLATITGILSYFSIFRKGMEWLFKLLRIPCWGWLIEITTFLVWLVFLFVLLTIIKHFVGRRYRKILGIYFGNLKSGIWPDGTGVRTTEFQQLRSDANNSMLVMGIGMTLLSRDLGYLERLLNRNLMIRLLMIDPDIMYQTLSLADNEHSIVIQADLFDQYFNREGYTTEVITSYKRLVNFIAKRKKDDDRRGRISLRKYPYLIPMNVTMIDEHDEKEHGRMLIEWCFPFSDCRMSSRLSQSSDKEMFHTARKNIENLWKKSQKVTDDFER